MTLNSQKCPHCGSDHLYLLGDGRCKCSGCRRKFSPGKRRSRLTPETVAGIISGFTEGTPASEVATDTGVNLKTVQHYYGQIRELLAEDRELYLSENYGNSEVSADLFNNSEVSKKWKKTVFIGCLIDNETEMDLLFAKANDADSNVRLDSSAVAGWLVAADRQALEKQQIDRMICLPGKRAKERARNFWINAKRHLSAYSGGFKKNFKLYLREMEFRDNMKNKTEAQQHIGKLLDRTTPTPTGGEEDA